MKKFSLVICVVTLLAVMLVGATAFASSGVSTNEHIYIGEYAHNNANNNDPNVVIVYGTASVDAQDGVTERGILIEKGTDKWLFPALSWDETTGNFGVAIIRSTVEKGEYVAKAFARVGGSYDEDEQEFVGGTIEEGDPISLNFNAVLSPTETTIEVNETTPVDLKELITVTGGEKAEITYTLTEKDGLELEVENGVVSYVSGAGRTTITATHGLSENSITFDVVAYDEVYEITEKSQLATLTTDHANSFVKLMNDLSVETADMAVTNVDNVDYAFVIGDEFKGFFDGQNHKIAYDFTCDVKDMLFRGVFCKLSGEVRNLIVDGFAEQKADYGYFFAHEVSGLVENCYVNVRGQQNASKSGNWTSTCFMIGTSSGTIKDCMFNMAGRIDSTSEFTRSMALQRYGTGVWENIVWIAPDKASPWRGGMYSAMMQDDQLKNVVYYKTISAFIQNDGQLFDYGVTGQEDNGDGTFSPKYGYVSTPITTAQVIGNAWTIDRTKLNESIKLNGTLIWKSDVVAISTKAEFLALGEIKSDVCAYLAEDITLTTADATVITDSTNAIFVDELNCILDGNGHKVTFSFTADGTTTKAFKGLFRTVNGTIRNLTVIGEALGNDDYATAFITTLSSGAVVENVYLDIHMNQPTSAKGNWNATKSIVGKNTGVVRNSVLYVTGDRRTESVREYGVPLQLQGAGKWENVAQVGPTDTNPYRTGLYNSKLSATQLNNVATYTSLANLVAGTGKTFEVVEGAYARNEFTTAQDLGAAWTIDATGIKLNGNYVYEVPVSE